MKHNKILLKFQKDLGKHCDLIMLIWSTGVKNFKKQD